MDLIRHCTLMFNDVHWLDDRTDGRTTHADHPHPFARRCHDAAPLIFMLIPHPSSIHQASHRDLLILTHLTES